MSSVCFEIKQHLNQVVWSQDLQVSFRKALEDRYVLSLG